MGSRNMLEAAFQSAKKEHFPTGELNARSAAKLFYVLCKGPDMHKYKLWCAWHLCELTLQTRTHLKSLQIDQTSSRLRHVMLQGPQKKVQ
jgi:hypothetical protein